jgi:hypothetical protein
VLVSSSLWLWESAFFADFHRHHQGQPPLKKMSLLFLSLLVLPAPDLGFGKHHSGGSLTDFVL